ncbi:GRIP domain-containing protein RUD3 [Aristolochia californica]|uniref:GRIP domain-containing protein RUD3 n=1 Tax=Aristolochia californica TaxID=171875 RepID=UPI0035D539B9
MALPSAFWERLQHMEETRKERASVLQAEKELQSKKSLLLAAKISDLRHSERRCLILEQKNAELNLQALAKKSEMEAIERDDQSAAQEFRSLKSEIDALEKREKEKEIFYEMKNLEMKEFRDEVERFVLESRQQVQMMKNTIVVLRSTYKELQASDAYLNNSEIVAAEKRNTELLSLKENLDESLKSNYKTRSVLRKQLQNILEWQRVEKPNRSNCDKAR